MKKKIFLLMFTTILVLVLSASFGFADNAEAFGIKDIEKINLVANSFFVSNGK